jgi:tRNA threonylcarbamoyladenosine biosynthesis protein TsaB
MYLFIDSTVNITLGILDEEFNWLEYNYIESKKSSALLHAEIERALINHNLKVNDIKGLIYMSGPGSYTGMRVSEGMAQIFKWRNFPVYSFYHFDIPNILKIEEGYFVSKAFKGELFVCNTKTLDKQLVPTASIDSVICKKIIYTNEIDSKILNTVSTSKIIERNPNEIFSNIVANKINNQIYYYRALEDEFKRHE